MSDALEIVGLVLAVVAAAAFGAGVGGWFGIAIFAAVCAACSLVVAYMTDKRS